MAIRNNRGQGVLEAVLVLMIMLVLSGIVASQFKQNELFAQLVQAPWARLSGMLQNGVWLPPKTGMAYHPTSHMRHISLKGDEPR